jgi:hypothetical protein
MLASAPVLTFVATTGAPFACALRAVGAQLRVTPVESVA